jgi:lantibiotic modifying enzyme
MATTRNLTGFAHGTAGIGCTLPELFHATSDAKYRDAAAAAFAYERR